MISDKMVYRPHPYIPDELKDIVFPKDEDNDQEKRFKVGMYGGKFMPFHKGHAHCIDVASSECDILYVAIFYTHVDEIRYRDKGLAYNVRITRLNDYLMRKKDNIKLILVCSHEFSENGVEDWMAEAKYIQDIIGTKIDAVYSSEPSYDSFFKKAYPEAIHRLVDPERKEVPISGTKIRSMTKEEARKWIM